MPDRYDNDAVFILADLQLIVKAAEKAKDVTDEQLDRANAILEGTSVFGKNAVSEMEKDSKIADMLFEVKELYFRLISLKSPNKLERSTWVRFLDFWRGRPTDGDVDVDIEHPVFTRLKDASVRLRSEADQRLAVLNPTLDVFQGVTCQWRTAAVLAQLSELVYHITAKDEKGENDMSNTDEWKAWEKDHLPMYCKQWIADPDDELRVQYVHSDDENADNAALIVVSSASIYLVFRGTVSWTNWRQNFNLTARAFPNSSGGTDESAGEVHGGFYAAQDSLWKKLNDPKSLLSRALVEPLKIHRESRRGVYIAGHSLGGAMAIITAARLVREKEVERIDGVYTFGGPALFDSTAAGQYDDDPKLMGRTFRVEYEGDQVVDSLALLRFFHPGVSIRLSERDGKTVEERVEYVPYFADILRNGSPSKFLLTGAKAHGMSKSYLATVHLMAQRAETIARPERGAQKVYLCYCR